jgi:hypothetical protein
MTQPNATPTARTTDSLGRGVLAAVVAGADWWESRYAAAPFPVDAGLPTCFAPADDQGPPTPWVCSRQSGHPMPHRAAIGHDDTQSWIVAEWEIAVTT